MRDPWPRAAGACLLLASVGSTLVHRQIYEATQGGPAQLSEFATGLLTMALASVGVLLLIHGSKLSVRPGTTVLPATLARARRDVAVQRLLASGSPESVLLDSRRGVALVLAYRALATVAVRDATPVERLSAEAKIAYRRNAARGAR